MPTLANCNAELQERWEIHLVPKIQLGLATKAAER